MRKFIQANLIFAIAIIGISFGSVSVDAAPVNQRTIEQKVGKKIRTLPYYGVFDIISFEVDGDTVVLSGQVYNARNKKSAEKRVRKIDGVENVVNNIEILPYSRFDNDIRWRTVRAFYRGGNLYRYLQGTSPSVRIIVNRGHVTLEGYVRSKGDSRFAEILAEGVFGTFSVTNNLVVTKENIKF